MSKRARTAEAKKQLATTERESKDDAWVESAFASRYNAQPTPKDRYTAYVSSPGLFNLCVQP